MKHKLIFVGACFWISSVSFAGGPPKESPALLEKGKAVYTTNCTVCHGDAGDGNSAAGAAMNPRPRNFTTGEPFKGPSGKGKIAKPTVQQIYDSIGKGVDGTSMVAFGYLPEEERWALAYYILKLKKK